MTPWKFLRRSAATIAALAVLPLLATGAQAQTKYPNGTISFVAAFPAGSGSDLIGRYFADRIGKLSGATIIVENKPGAGGNIAAQYTARAAPDGHTVYIHAGNSTAANMHLFKKPPIDVAKDLRAIATIHTQGFMVTVAANSPHDTLQKLTAAMKQKGNKASYAYNNTTGRVMGELYRKQAGIEAVPVAYSASAETLNDVLSGAVDYAVHDPVFAMAQASQGRLKILAVGLDKRLKAAADVPTMAEAGVQGINLPSWFGVFVPGATPDPIANQLNDWFRQVLTTAETEKFLRDFGGDVLISTPQQAHALLEKDVRDWEEHVRMAQIPQQ